VSSSALGRKLPSAVTWRWHRHPLEPRWSFGLSVVYNWMADFAEPIGKRDNYSGFDLRLSVGWLFGKGSAPRR